MRRLQREAPVTAALAERDIPVENIEHALKIVAYAVIRHGPKYAPLLDRLEAELTKPASDRTR